MCIVAECLRCFQDEGSCIMHHFCSFLFTILFCTGVQSVLQYTQVPHDQQPLPQQLHATAEQPHVPPPVTPYHLPTQQHTQVSGYGHEFGSQPVYPLCSQQQEVTPQGNF